MDAAAQAEVDISEILVLSVPVHSREREAMERSSWNLHWSANDGSLNARNKPYRELNGKFIVLPAAAVLHDDEPGSNDGFAEGESLTANLFRCFHVNEQFLTTHQTAKLSHTELPTRRP